MWINKWFNTVLALKIPLTQSAKKKKKQKPFFHLKHQKIVTFKAKVKCQ